jgi:hypothetical protein
MGALAAIPSERIAALPGFLAIVGPSGAGAAA